MLLVWIVVDVPSGQVTYDFMMDADLYNSFLLQLSVYISLWYYILVQFVMSSEFFFPCIVLYLLLLFLFTCSICVILLNTYVWLCLNELFGTILRAVTVSLNVYICLQRGGGRGVKISVLRYVRSKWIARNKCCRIFFKH